MAEEEEGLGRQKKAVKSHITVSLLCSCRPIMKPVPSHNEIHGFSFDLSMNNITETAHAKRNFPMHLKLAVPILPSHPTPPPPFLATTPSSQHYCWTHSATTACLLPPALHKISLKALLSAVDRSSGLGQGL